MFVGHLSKQDQPIEWLDLSYNALDEETGKTLQDMQQQGAVVFALRKDKSTAGFSHPLISGSRIVRVAPNPEDFKGRSRVLDELGPWYPSRRLSQSPEPVSGVTSLFMDECVYAAMAARNSYL